MTDEKPGNGSRLKSALGLENLKGLGETLKQIKEVKESLDEAQKTIGDLAKDNSPMGRALAQLIEAHGIKTLSEDNINALQEVKEKMEQQLEEKDKTIEQLGGENRDLREDKVVKEVTDLLDRRLPQPGNPNGGESKLMGALEKVVADYMEKRLLGSGGDAALTSEQIRTIIKDEVTPVIEANKKPEDLVENVVNALTMGDKLREKLGMAGGGLGGRFLPSDGDGGGLRGDLLKLLLEDERERLKIEHEHESKVERNKQVGIFVGAFKENAGDIAAGLRVAAEEVKRTQGTAKETEAPPPPQVFKCGDCGTTFSPPPGWAGQNIECPKTLGGCGRIYTKEELLE